MLSHPQRQAEQRELAEHMLLALEQQSARTAQQAEDQQQLIAQANSQIQVKQTLNSYSRAHRPSGCPGVLQRSNATAGRCASSILLLLLLLLLMHTDADATAKGAAK